MFGIDDIISTGLKVLDKVIPDPVARDKAKAELLALKQKGAIKLEEVDVKREEGAAQDRNSARKMQYKTKSPVPAILSGAVTLGFFGALFIMLIDGVPEGEKDVLLVMLGSLGTAWTGVVNYWFGSSTGSKEKTHLMGDK